MQLDTKFIAVAGEYHAPFSRLLWTWPDKMGRRAEGEECLYPIMNWRKWLSVLCVLVGSEYAVISLVSVVRYRAKSGELSAFVFQITTRENKLFLKNMLWVFYWLS